MRIAKVPGVIGGLGPQTTADFYMRVQQLALERGSAVRPPMLIASVALPYTFEQQAIRNGDGIEKIKPYLIGAAQQLQAGGADFVVMTCNTLHVLTQDIRANLSIPFISIIDETVQKIIGEGITHVGILSTGSTADEHVYDKALQQHGITLIRPTGTQQMHLNEIIIRLLDGKHTNADRVLLHGVALSLKKQGAEAILLACTDLHIIYDEAQTNIPALDTVEVLVQATVREMSSDLAD